ncbi:helix-turn-helix transcriptional regulator [Marinomonas gallaica]|uniref:helix-turn-helix transcriptional regulator n=1 Tax=Marinomonas gallaica TaxID=1806667 RepID=UPI003CE4914E
MNSLENHMSREDELTLFSQTLFEIYRLAREEPLESFLETMVECVQSLIPFNSAWLGRGSGAFSTLEYMHSNYLYNLPEDYYVSWKKVKDQDTALFETHRHLGKAISLNFMTDDISPELHSLGQDYQFDKLMCVLLLDRATGLGNHFSLYRNHSLPEYTEREKQLFQALMPHLLSASSINQIRSHYHLFGSRTEAQVVLATCNGNGSLLSAEPALAELLQLEYPDWRGPQLPFIPTLEGFHGKHLVIDVFPRDDQLLLAARPICAIEQLSVREQEVALLFGSGSTYKEIARQLGVSPNTVRYHLRSIYSKLGTNTKSDLSRLLTDIPSIVND